MGKQLIMTITEMMPENLHAQSLECWLFNKMHKTLVIFLKPFWKQNLEGKLLFNIQCPCAVWIFTYKAPHQRRKD